MESVASSSLAPSAIETVRVRAVPSIPARPSLWILDRWRDLCLFVGTPLLLIPIFSAAQARWSAQDIFLFVGAFGAMGHHLPGMIRAYGDRGLFSRFRTRFLVAPIILLTVSIWASWFDIQALQLLAMAWGIWHGMMQTYGFCRIYDGKASASGRARARADFALCLVWFIAAVLLSHMRFRTFFELYYESGGPVISAAAVSALRTVVVSLLAGVTIYFAFQQWIHWRRKRWASPIKLTLLTSSIAFWWYCNNGVQNILVGIALFEVFHDVQYLAIVWIYNRSRVERDESIRGFMRFVFRKSGALIGVYVGLVLAYGSIAFSTSASSAFWIRHALIGLVTASALLHFYYDGFIWKVRETQTRAMLGIEGAGIGAVASRFALPLWLRHGLRWALIAVPFAALCCAQLLGRVVPPLERTQKVAEVLPNDAQAQLNYGKALHEAGDVDKASRQYQLALERDPTLAEAEFFLGLADSDSRDYTDSIKHYVRSLELNPKYGKAEFNLGSVLLAEGQQEEARRHLEHSLTLDPNMFLAHQVLGDILCQSGDFDAAIGHYEAALRLSPQFAAAADGLSHARSLARR